MLFRSSLALALGATFVSRFAQAADAAPAMTIDLTALFSPLMPLVATAVGAVALALAHRGLRTLQAAHLLQSDAATNAAIDTAIQTAETWARQRLEGLPERTVTTHSTLAMDAAYLVRAILPAALKTVPLDLDAIAQRIRMGLGDPTLGLATSASPTTMGGQPPFVGKLPSVAASVAVLLCLALAACGLDTPQGRAKLSNAAAVGCLIDSVVEPVGETVAGAMMPADSPWLTVEQLVVHPAVVKLCSELGGRPTAVPVPAPALVPTGTAGS